jgi:hypothetical protein
MPDEKQAALDALAKVAAMMGARFGAVPGPNHSARLEQLDSALGTAKMAVSHLFDEDERERELHGRMVSAAQKLDRVTLDQHGHQGLGWVEE